MSGSAGWFERGAVTVLPVALGAGVFAVAFVHVHDVARWAGQPDWAAWLIATTGEAMAVAALAAIRACRQADAPIGWPVFVLLSAVLLSGACNLAAVLGRPGWDAPHDAGPITGDPGAWVWVMAVWPVVAFGLVAGLKATLPHGPHESPDASETSLPASTIPPVSARSLNSATGREWARGRAAVEEAQAAALRDGADVDVVVPVSEWQSTEPADPAAGTAEPRARRASTGTRSTGTGTRSTGTTRAPARSTGTAAGTGLDVSDLLVPGREVARALAAAGQKLTRDNLLDGLQQRGHGASTRRAGTLLAALKAEADRTLTATPVRPTPTPAPPVAEVHGVPAARTAEVPVTV